jgi:hypothetical protein
VSADVETAPVAEAPPTVPTESAPVGAPPPAPPVDAGAPQGRRRWPWIVALVVVFGLLVAGGALAGATVAYAESQTGRFLPGTVVAGVDVSGMTQDEALGQVRAALSEQLDRRVTVRSGDQRWRATARQLGARSNARKVLADVAAAQVGVTWQEWARMRWLGDTVEDTADVSVKHRRKGIRRFVSRIAADVNAAPRDAKLEVVDGKVVITAERFGRQVLERKAVATLAATLEGGHSRMGLPVREVRPDVRAGAYDQVLLLDQSQRKLTLYLDGRRHTSWVVAVGTGEYPTPLGRYTINLKRYMPTWINPDPDGWGADMPAQIGPGPGNPLGVRALNWDAPGAIRFHGTQAVNSLGTAASHGCVRMSNSDVTELYDLVDVGAVIISQA